MKKETKNYIETLFNKLLSNGFVGNSGIYKESFDRKRWIDGKFIKDNFRVIDQEHSIRFEIKNNGKWKNLCKNTNYKKDFPIIPEIFNCK